jgi:hypothetical protein
MGGGPGSFLIAISRNTRAERLCASRADCYIEHSGSREGINLGPLTGYAVLYRFVAKVGRDSFAEVLAARDAGLQMIHLTGADVGQSS